MITYDEAFALVKQAEPIGLLQSHVEAAHFAQFVANVIKPVHILEIGTCSGGNLYLMHLAALAGGAREGARLSIDMPWAERDPNVYGHEQRFKNVLPQVVEVIGNSHAPDTLRRVKEALWRAGKPEHVEQTDNMVSPQGWPEAKLDLIFQDASHDYDGAKRDFADYSPLLVGGGYYAQHDLLNGWAAGVFMREELFPQYEHWQFEEPGNLYGIGVVKIP